MASKEENKNDIFSRSREMSKLLLPIGMIGSGKSTWAKQYIKENPDTKIVGGDEIRLMLSGGDYIHDEKMEPMVLDILLAATNELLGWGYDVILDECYCSLNRNMRKRVATMFAAEEIIAVVFPERDMQDHIDDKILKGLRGKTVNYWKRVFCEMKDVYEPFTSTEEYFSEVIFVK